MFKKRAFLAVLAVGLLASCSKGGLASDGNEYEQATDVPTTPYTMYIIGSHFNGWGEATINATDDFKFQPVTGQAKFAYEITITQGMIDDWFGFKFIETNSWTVQYGAEDIDWDKCNAAFKELVGFTALDAWRSEHHEGTGNRGNVVPDRTKLAVGGRINITYDPFDYRSADAEGTTYSYHFSLNYTAPTVA